MNPSTVTARRFRHSGIPASYWIRRKSKRSWHMPICIIFWDTEGYYILVEFEDQMGNAVLFLPEKGGAAVAFPTRQSILLCATIVCMQEQKGI